MNNKNDIIKEFTVYNGTSHDTYLYRLSQTRINRNHKYVLKTPEERPNFFKALDTPINANLTIKQVPPSIDNTGLFLPQDDFYGTYIEMPAYQTDIVIGSSRYFWACLHNLKNLPPFYIDRLYIPQPVYDHNPDPNHAKYFNTPAKPVGYILKAAMAPYAPWEYVQAINSGIQVSAASLQSCIMYYTQEKVKNREMMSGYTSLFEHIDFLQKQLEYQVAKNRNFPDYMFPTPIDHNPTVNPGALAQDIRPAAVTFEA